MLLYLSLYCNLALPSTLALQFLVCTSWLSVRWQAARDQVGELQAANMEIRAENQSLVEVEDLAASLTEENARCSLTVSHSDSLPLIHCLSLSFTASHSHPLSLTPIHCLSLTFTASHSHPLSLTHIHCLSLSFTVSHSHPLSLTLIHCLSLKFTGSLSH